jgi:hypothetical protein
MTQEIHELLLANRLTLDYARALKQIGQVFSAARYEHEAIESSLDILHDKGLLSEDAFDTRTLCK